MWPAHILFSLSVAFQCQHTPCDGVLTGNVCGHSGRDDFTTQARLIYVGKALRAPTESVERIRRPFTKPVMANQQLRPPTDGCQDQLQDSVWVDGMGYLLYCCSIIVWSLYYSMIVAKLFSVSVLVSLVWRLGTYNLMSWWFSYSTHQWNHTHVSVHAVSYKTQLEERCDIQLKEEPWFNQDLLFITISTFP